MTPPRALILRAPGTNCEEETARAWRLAGADPEIAHIGRILEEPGKLEAFQILTVPGGFSYGDDLGAGRIFAIRLAAKLGDSLTRFRDRGGLILGICNGFQTLVKTGLLPGAGIAATITYNDVGRYEARWARVKANPNAPGPWLDGLSAEASFELPVAHGEGKFLVSRSEDLDRLLHANQISLQYVDDQDQPASSHPHNPSGSPLGITGVTDSTGRVFGLMPHPERFVETFHHPRWTRKPIDRVPDGLRIFQNAVRAC